MIIDRIFNAACLLITIVLVIIFIYAVATIPEE